VECVFERQLGDLDAVDEQLVEWMRFESWKMENCVAEEERQTAEVISRGSAQIYGDVNGT
jgi:hypothetical protein